MIFIFWGGSSKVLFFVQNYVQIYGYWSRRITDEHRLVYQVLNDRTLILQCKFHY